MAPTGEARPTRCLLWQICWWVLDFLRCPQVPATSRPNPITTENPSCLSPLFLCERFLTLCCEGRPIWKALLSLPGGLRMQGPLSWPGGSLVWPTAWASPGEEPLGLSQGHPLLPSPPHSSLSSSPLPSSPLPLLLLLTPHPPYSSLSFSPLPSSLLPLLPLSSPSSSSFLSPLYPSSIQRTQSLQPCPADTEARSEVSRRLFDLLGNNGQGSVGAGMVGTGRESCLLPTTTTSTPRGQAPRVISPASESYWDPGLWPTRGPSDNQGSRAHQLMTQQGTPVPCAGSVSPFSICQV